MNKNNQLSEKHRLLLCCYHDRECSWLQRFRVGVLLKHSVAANEYLSGLNEIGDVAREAFREPPIAVAPSVLARIEQEERTALYLGERRMPVVEKEAWRIPWYSSMGWGAAGAGVAAAVIFFVVLPLNFRGELGVVASSVAPAISPVVSSLRRAPAVFQASQEGVTPATSSRLGLSRRAPFELDWVRSDGRVTVIPGPDQKSGVIWVRRATDRYPYNRSPRKPLERELSK